MGTNAGHSHHKTERKKEKKEGKEEDWREVLCWFVWDWEREREI